MKSQSDDFLIYKGTAGNICVNNSMRLSTYWEHRMKMIEMSKFQWVIFLVVNCQNWKLTKKTYIPFELPHRQNIWSSDVSLWRFEETPAFPWDADYSEKGASAWSPDLWPPGFAWGGWMEGNLGFWRPVRISQAFLSARDSGSAADTPLMSSHSLRPFNCLSFFPCLLNF